MKLRIPRGALLAPLCGCLALLAACRLAPAGAPRGAPQDAPGPGAPGGLILRAGGASLDLEELERALYAQAPRWVEALSKVLPPGGDAVTWELRVWRGAPELGAPARPTPELRGASAAPLAPEWHVLTAGDVTLVTPEARWAPGLGAWVGTLDLAARRTLGLHDQGGAKPVLEASLDRRTWLAAPCELRGGLWVARHLFRTWSAILPPLEAPTGAERLVWLRRRGAGGALPVLARL